MSIPKPPQELFEWKIDILNELIKIPNVEGELFDFKGRDIGDLAQSICAMGNTSGGILFLGIGEIKENDELIEFKKEPFKRQAGDQLNNRVSHHMHNLEVLPKVTSAYLEETDKSFGDKSLYKILKVEPVIRNRPYMLKTGQCYIRVGSSNLPAGRNIIINLCKQTIDRTTIVTHLEATAGMLNRQLQHISERATGMSQENRESPFFLPVIDLSLFKQAATNCIWFLVEYCLITGRLKDATDDKYDFYSSIYFIEELNSAINRFNIEQMNAGNRNDMFLIWYRKWESGHLQKIIDYLSRVMDSAKDFLS